MQEFMLLVRNEGERLAALTPEKRLEFVKKCEVYIGDLKKKGKLIATQPLIREGKIISGTPSAWKEDIVNEKKEIQVGYYHILADNIDDAVAIAKGNPEFEYTPTAKLKCGRSNHRKRKRDLYIRRVSNNSFTRIGEKLTTI